MGKSLAVTPIAGVHVVAVERLGGHWVISAAGPGQGLCPACGTASRSRHSSYSRRLQDLPAQGAPVTIALRVARLRCRQPGCDRRIFSERLPEVMLPLARRTRRVGEIVRLLGHSAGGRPAERLLTRLGLAVSDDTVLRHLKRHAVGPPIASPLRVVGIDDWSWRKGQTYGTIMVDLEKHSVVDLLADRSSGSVATWLAAHPGVEIVSRDRHGLYAEGARNGAPQARQVADRFHLVQNLREMIEKQLGRLGRPLREQAPAAAVEDEDTRAGLHGIREAMFNQVRALYDAGLTATSITQKLGLSRTRVDKWIRLETLPERHAMVPTPVSPAYYQGYLARRWAEGCTVARRLFTEIQGLGFTGCYTHLARFIASWRRAAETTERKRTPDPVALLPHDPTTGRLMTPQIASALCIKPRPQLTPPQAMVVDTLKVTSPDFAAMRRLAMRFRGILRGRDVQKLDVWLTDAHRSGVYSMQRFARTLQGDLDAVRNGVTEPWSNGQTEGQISRLKTLKRAMYGRAGIELLRARMLPLEAGEEHRE